jgi:hypothetical protein
MTNGVSEVLDRRIWMVERKLPTLKRLPVTVEGIEFVECHRLVVERKTFPRYVAQLRSVELASGKPLKRPPHEIANNLRSWRLSHSWFSERVNYKRLNLVGI